MKKITAFFLAFLPLFIIVLLFITGMLIKNYTHVFVSAVEFTKPKIELQWVDDKQPKTEQTRVNVLPFNATNPEVEYFSTNTDVVEIDDHGLLKVVDFGEAKIYAVSKENETLYDECDVVVWDDKVHRIDVLNEYQANYMSQDQTINLQAVPVPIPSKTDVGDLSLHYEYDHDILDIAPDGEVTPLQECKDGIEVVVSMEDETTYPDIQESVTVRVGPGVTAMEFDSPVNETISGKEYDLFEHLVTYPESCERESEVFGPTDFTYEINQNDDVATVDQNGKLTFKQPGKVEVNVTCRRNTDLSITKIIESTFNGYTDVAFNKYKLIEPWNESYRDQAIPANVLNWQTYPAIRTASDVTITSSREDVVEVRSGPTTAPELIAKGPGSTLLTITAPAGDGTVISDVCYVSFPKDITDSIIREAAVTLGDSYNYYLRSNIKTEVLNDPHEKITWTSSDESIAHAKDDVLHFYSRGTVTITASINGVEKGNFTVTCSAPTTTLKITSTAPVNLQAGQRYAFTDNDGNPFAPDDVSENQFIDVGDGTYIAKQGVSMADYVFYYIYDWDITIKTNLIISEPVFDIYFDPNDSVYNTSIDKLDYSNIAHLTPSTATDINGNPIALQTTFVPENPEAVTISGNSLNFEAATKVLATSTFNGKDYQFLICGDFKHFGKFNLLSNPDNPETKVFSGETVEFSSEVNEVSYYLDAENQTADFAEQFDFGSRNGNDIVECSKTFDTGKSKVKFTFKPKEGMYGQDTIIIKSGTFNFYLNISLEEKISNFKVSFKGQELTSGANKNTAYTKNLVLNVSATPLDLVKEGAYTATLNGQSLDIDWNRGTIDLSDKITAIGTYTLKLEAAAKYGNYAQEFVIDYQDLPSPTDLKFDIEGSYEKDGDKVVPIMCGATQKTLSIKLQNRALVDSTLFENLHITLDGEGECDTHPNARGKAYIQDIPVPTNENKGEYEANLSIDYKGTVSLFKLSREIVSKIEFPGHDNNSMSDQKGLQKVHVFGNKSYYDPQDYDPEEKRGPLLDYYKLPINLYDYKGELIEDDPTIQGDKTKEKAFNTLNAYVNDTTLGSFTYKNVDESVDKVNKTDFIAISFTERALYDQEEINNNIFDGHEPNKVRNVNFGVSTWTGSAHADYTFVPVEGVNAYCQEALRDDNNIPIYKVLQTNFGLGPEVQDNAPLTDTTITALTTVYGNGYTLNFSALNKLGDDQGIFCQHVFNATISGCLDNETDHIAVNLAPDRNEKHPFAHLYYRYSVFKNLLFGINVYNNRTAHIKDCLCYDNKLSSIVASGNDKSGAVDYIEDTVMFNCSSTALMQTPTAKMYFKGFVDVYNFKGKEILKNLPFDIGDLSYLWPVVESTASAAGVLQKTAAGTTAVNSALISVNSSNIYFWDGNQYVQSGKGLPTAFNYVVPYFDVPVEIMGLKPGLWGTLVPNASRPDAPSYYDQFDGEGNLRWDFLNNQLVKIMRPWSPLPYNTH